MTHQLLDLKRIRRNWERAEVGTHVEPPDRLAHVSPPVDVYALGASLLERLQRELTDQFPDKREPLRPFLARAAALFERMREQPGEAELRGEFVAALSDLEDLCEAFLSVRR